MSENCLFCKIVSDEIPSSKVYEDDEFVAFRDIQPAAPVHLLLVPKHHIVSMADVGETDAPWLGRMLVLANKLAKENGCRPGHEGGFRLVANTGKDGGQEIGHLHLHILGGERPWQNRAAPAA
jgi:histidine triad (HIT) family protein